MNGGVPDAATLMGGSSASTAVGTYYPIWPGGETCRNDGKAPAYMKNKPDVWLYMTLEDCCDRYFNWITEKCIANGPAPATSPAVPSSAYTMPPAYLSYWYPGGGSSGFDYTCTNLDMAPGFMTILQDHYFELSLDECCDRFYSYGTVGPQWNAACKANTATGLVALSPTGTTWYADAGEGAPPKCINDGNAPNYMRINPGLWVHSTKEECCSHMYGDVPAEEQICLNDGVVPPAPVAEKWYVDWTRTASGSTVPGICVKSCPTSSGDPNCGGIRETWEGTSPDANTCCKTHLSFKKRADCTVA
jgi:hypothetical protein